MLTSGTSEKMTLHFPIFEVSYYRSGTRRVLKSELTGGSLRALPCTPDAAQPDGVFVYGHAE